MEGWAQLTVSMILLSWFDHLLECFSYKEDQFRKFYPPVKPKCLPSEDVNEAPVKNNNWSIDVSRSEIQVLELFLCDSHVQVYWGYSID